jgi:predicted kinase
MHFTPRHAGPRVVVCGPPASGKTTWVNEKILPGDLVWDTDAIASAICHAEKYPRSEQTVNVLMAMRRAFIQAAQECQGTVYLIVTEESQARTLNDKLGGRLVVMNTPEAVCVERIMADPSRSKDQVEAVQRWWKQRG